MCKKWYQLITCTEPVGALNRRSFLCLKPRIQFRDAGLSVVTAGQKCVRSTSLWHQFDIFLQVSAGIRTFSAGFLQVNV